MTENKKRKRKRKTPYNSISYTTGDIGLNINRFNQAFGTGESSCASCGDQGGGALAEAKRYVRRYYFRPMNKFASNKAEILKTLIEIGDQNCAIYTLNNLGDDKDVSKLSSNDIIYTYDDGILKDKNGIRIMDYDLSIKKEEERKKFSNVDQASDKEFKAEYEDRMTDATELEEAFNLDFVDINVYGEQLTEAKHTYCCICGEPVEGYGNNPEPYASEGRCCDSCNIHFVIPMRIDMVKED